MKIISLIHPEIRDVFWTTDNIAHAARIGEVVEYPLEGFDSAAFIRAHPDTEIIITSWSSPNISPEIVTGLPRLRMLAHAAGSVRGIFDKSAWDDGVTVLTGAGTIGRFVGEMTLTMALCGLRRIVQHNESTGRGRWHPAEARCQTLFDARVGLAGFGFAARHAARLFRGFTADIFAYDPYVSGEEMRESGVHAASLEQIFSSSRVLSLHLPNLPSTRHMITPQLLNSMPEGAVLVNTARGAVVDHELLAEFLRNRTDIVALLDVTDPEPLPEGHELRRLPNVVLTPHISGGADGSRALILHNLLNDIEAVLAGEDAPSIVTAANRERMA